MPLNGRHVLPLGSLLLEDTASPQPGRVTGRRKGKKNPS